MKRRNFDYIIIVVMLLSGLYTLLTGLVADLLGIRLMAFHLHYYAGYACAILAGIHLVINWKKIRAFLRRRV
ncbi:MAG: hypothetical protein GY832_22975 [Chloroflexi bacterium]|nr:hypothetical protein [Chloroflexota bacterium]